MSVDPNAAAKEHAARYAVAHYVVSGMKVGLGTGTTAAYVVRALAERIQREGLTLSTLISTSYETAALARSLGMVLDDELTLENTPLDVTIDGTDEADDQLNLIKGGGGALLREKLVAVATRREIIVGDPHKRVSRLGRAHALPIMIVPYAWKRTQARVEEICGRPAPLRLKADGTPFISDDALYCLDIAPGEIPDAPALETALKSVTGVVDVGLFIGLAHVLVVGHPDGRIEEFTPVAG